jgi:hypothetical protein
MPRPSSSHDADIIHSEVDAPSARVGDQDRGGDLSLQVVQRDPALIPEVQRDRRKGTAIYGKAALELNVPVPEAIKLSNSRAAVLIE